MKTYRVYETCFILVALLASAACDSTDGAGQGGAAGQGGDSQGAGATGGRYSIGRAGDTFTIGSNDPGFPGNGGSGGQGSSGGGMSGTGGGSTTAPACTLTGPTGAAPATAVCGDGLLSSTEQCDDANLSPDDACSATCVVTPRAVAPHDESNAPLHLSAHELGSSAHPVAVGCNRAAVSFVDRATEPAALKLATYSRFGVSQAVVGFGYAGIDDPNPAVAALDDDTFVAAWTDFDDDELGVRLRKIDPESASQPAAIFANSEQEFTQRFPDVVFDGSQLVVAWVDNADPANGPDLRYRTFSSDLKPTSGELTLAASGAVEDHVVLAGQDGKWAAAWRSGSSGVETIEVQSGASHWSVGPFLPGPDDDHPALVFLDARHLAVAFSAGSDESASGLANTPHLHGAILDAAFPGHVESFKVEPKMAPYSLLPQIGQSQPSIANLGDRLLLAWRSSAIPGAPEGEELWAREISWTISGNALVVDTAAAERPLPNGGEFRAGDQSRPVLLSSRYWPEHRLLSVWEDRSGSFQNLFGASEVGVQFSRVPSQLPTTPDSGPCLDTIMTASPNLQALPPAVVKLTAAAKCGGAVSAEYKFGYQRPDLGGPLNVIRDWGKSSADWKTTDLPSGRYIVWVYARRPGTSVAFDSYWGIEYYLGHVCYANPSLTISPPGIQPLGTNLTLSATATCNDATPEYRFQYTAPGSSSLVDIGTWSTTPVNWDTAGVPSGISNVYAYIRAAGNSSTYEGFASGTARLGNICSALNSITATPSSPQSVGTNISLSANASCTSGATPEFRYSYTRSDLTSWFPIGSWSTSPVAWNSTGLPAGTYTLWAEVRAAGNASGAEASAQTSFTLQPASSCSATLTATNGPVGLGNSVPLSASASCGSSPSYRFGYAPAGSSSYTYLTAWGATTSATWDTTGLYPNSYDVAVFVRMNTTTSGYDGLQKKTIRLGTKCTSILLQAWQGTGTLLTLGGSAWCYDPEFIYYLAVADGNQAWTAINSTWVNGALDFDQSTVTPGMYEFKVDAREGVLGSADGTSDSILHQVGPGCTSASEIGALTGHPQAIGTPMNVWLEAYCDDGVTPEYAFFYLPPGETDYVQFPGTGWESNGTATLDTTDFTSGGEYEVKVLVRGVGHVGAFETTSLGWFVLEDP